jgi:dTMP kinase
MHKGILIAIEGIDGSGKDSQAQRLEEWISARGLNVFRFSFPTYTTPLGKVIQQALTESSFDPHALQLLFSAERMSHKPAILHALTKASAVITARYSASSTIYPVARGLEKAWCIGLEEPLPRPDVTILLDVDVEISLRRSGKTDILESNAPLLRHCRDLYLELASHSSGWHVVNARRTLDEVHRDITNIVGSYLSTSAESDG